MTSAILATFSDVVGFLAQSFKLAAVLPAFVFVFLNEIAILPHLPQRGFVAQIMALDLLGKFVVAALLSVVLGYALTIANIPLIQLFEGYPWCETWYGKWLTGIQQARKRALEEQVPRMENQIEALRERAKRFEPRDRRRRRLVRRRKALEQSLYMGKVLSEQELRESFPTATPILPTALGNSIATFEDYPRTRYGIDSVTLWPRLLTSLTETGYATYVEREKAGIDFALNLSFLLLILSFETICVGLLFGETYLPWFIGAGAAMLLARVLYKIAIVGAFGWGMTVRVAFDLYRYHMLRALYGQAPRNFSSERKKWQQISQFLREGEFPTGGLDNKMLEILHYSRIRQEVEAVETPEKEEQ